MHQRLRFERMVATSPAVVKGNQTRAKRATKTIGKYPSASVLTVFTRLRLFAFF